VTVAERELVLDRLDAIERRIDGLGQHLAAAQLEPWLTKRKLAEILAVSPRWVDDRVAEGMPHRALAGANKFRLSAVEPWLTAHGYLEENA
jgi:hypothetical protein